MGTASTALKHVLPRKRWSRRQMTEACLMCPNSKPTLPLRLSRSTIWSIQMFPKRVAFAKRRSRKRSKERRKRSEKNVEKTKKSVQMAKRWGASDNRNTIENRALNKVAKTLE